MEFNELVLEKLHQIFQKNNLRIIEMHKSRIELQSSYLTIIIAHNSLENSNFLSLGRNNDPFNQVEIDNDVLRVFFQSALRLSQVNTETFIDNLAVFFENEAKPLLNGDLTKTIKLEEFDQKRADDYTKELLERQNLNAANEAWEKKNFKDFIKYLDNIREEKLLPSYKLKYKIARQKLKK